MSAFSRACQCALIVAFLGFVTLTTIETHLDDLQAGTGKSRPTASSNDLVGSSGRTAPGIGDHSNKNHAKDDGGKGVAQVFLASNALGFSGISALRETKHAPAPGATGDLRKVAYAARAPPAA
ncbi:hypothetical protein [Blastomonas sp.]|uniref:hypothetical protein n=1 Tax=Blastomonas sp. TaxID=1909299 RepID=UPI003593EA8D